MIILRQPDLTARRAGLGGVEVIVLVGLFGTLMLFVLIALPRGRETSRMVTCQRNLMQIGVATQLYEQANRHYPTVPALGKPTDAGGSPIETMLQALTLPDFLELKDASRAPKPGQAPGRGARVAGLICPSDANATSATSSNAVSYRANAGDGTDGANGPFAPGEVRSAAAIEAADGLSFTAGFGERLLGTGRDDQPGVMNYVEVAGPVTGATVAPAPGTKGWRGDAGLSWADPSWRSAIYTHATRPNAPTTAIAADGKTATVSTSSAHPGRINVWMLDGSLRGVTPTIDPSVWKAMGSIGTTVPAVEPVR